MKDARRMANSWNPILSFPLLVTYNNQILSEHGHYSRSSLSKLAACNQYVNSSYILLPKSWLLLRSASNQHLLLFSLLPFSFLPLLFCSSLMHHPLQRNYRILIHLHHHPNRHRWKPKQSLLYYQNHHLTLHQLLRRKADSNLFTGEQSSLGLTFSSS